VDDQSMIERLRKERAGRGAGGTPVTLDDAGRKLYEEGEEKGQEWAARAAGEDQLGRIESVTAGDPTDHFL
jgi:hypothetical protein